MKSGVAIIRGETHVVWEIMAGAFTIPDFELDWS
jgi:hypothetical protein